LKNWSKIGSFWTLCFRGGDHKFLTCVCKYGSLPGISQSLVLLSSLNNG